MLNIEGADKLLDRFGFFPVFHDGEILSVTLDRDTLAATFTLLVPEFKDKQHLGSVEVVLKFFDIEKFRLEEFNHQNVISSLTFETVIEKTEYLQEELPRIHVDLDTLFGAWATFSCSRIQVQSVTSSAQLTGNRISSQKPIDLELKPQNDYDNIALIRTKAKLRNMLK